ncbi:MAG: hypothetical protein V2A34_07360, partial [Lentisphaerota bacterium]
CHWKPESSLFREDFSRTPLAGLYELMVYSNWWTQAAGLSDSVGRYACQAFYGDYEIEALTLEGVYTNTQTTLTSADGATVITFKFGGSEAPVAKKKHSGIALIAESNSESNADSDALK